MNGERIGLNGMTVLIALVAAVLIGFTVLLLVNAHKSQPLQTNAVSSASASLSASTAQ